MKIICNFQDATQTGFRGVNPYSLKEIMLTSDMKIDYCRGFYTQFKGDLLGIVATGDGPVFFYNQDKYLLQENAYSFLLQKKNTENVFFFEWQGACVMQISYTPVLVKQGGKWVDDLIWDFFSWLTNAVRMKRFFNYYTVSEIPSLLGNDVKPGEAELHVLMQI